MRAWLSRFWNDEAAFLSRMIALKRFGLAFVGFVIDRGWLPVPLPGDVSNHTVGTGIIVAAFLFATGERNRPPATPAPPPDA